MKRRLIVSVAVLCLVIAASLSAYAQGRPKTLIAEIGFPFTVGDKSFAAGSYRIELVNAKPAVLMIRPAAGGEDTRIPIITRLAQANRAKGETEVSLVFDTVGNEKFLSEVWLPAQDGFLVRGTSEEHEHSIVKAKS